MLRVGMVGAGWVTQHHLGAWKRIGARARVVSIADPARQRADERARAFGIERVFDDAARLLDAGGIDAVDVAAPRELHAPVVRLAAERGLPILCQKPLAPTYGEALALVDDVAGRTRLMVHENWRFRPYYRRIREWLDAGRIGRVTQAQMTLVTSGLIRDANGEYPAVKRQPFLATLERALVMEIVIHHLDTLRFLLGEMSLAHARLGKSSDAIRGEDRAFAAFATDAGADVSLIANLCVHGEAAALFDRLVLVGDRGTIRLTGPALVCEGESPAEERFDLAACYDASYAGAIAHFVDALASGAPFETHPRDNLRTLQLVEEIYACH